MKHKVFRALCALLLVCVLLVSWSPIRARAMMPVVGWDSFAWNLADIISSGAIGIGTSPGSVPDDWNNMIEDAKQACQDFFGFVGDTMKIYRFFDGSSYTLYAKADFVEWLRAFLWDSGTFAYGTSFYDDLTDGQRSSYLSGCNEPHAVCWVSGGILHVASSAVALSVRDVSNDASGWYAVVRKDGGAFYHQQIDTDGSSWPTETTSRVRIYSSSWAWIGTDDEKEIVSSFDLGYVAPLEVPISEGYPEWVQNSVYIPAEVAGMEEEVLALPLGLGQTLDETQGLNQEQIWAGESTLEVEIDEALEGTVSGTTWADFTTWFGQKLEWIPKYILEGITAIFVPRADFLEAKVADLKARFPFIDGIIGLGEFVSESLSYDAGPPVLYVDFGPATTDTFGHRKYLLTDFSWYAPYKPTVDALMSSILWAFYGWRIFVRLPSIIGGEGGQVINVAFHSASARNVQEAERDRKKHKGG